MTSPSRRPRACALIFDQRGRILLILRRRGGKHYATLPGGGIESGETPAEAAAREVLEEVNLTVTIREQVLEMDNLDNYEHYFLARVTGGEMRLGDGPEGLRQSAENWYEPAWVEVSRLAEVNLVPEALRALVAEYRPPAEA